jgi:pyruvate dehydrogenase E2 component (dihydrolipoamide acetyltransferase)
VTQLHVPDIGDFKDIPVIEVLVQVGEKIAKDQPVVTLESDKAVMEVPSTATGVVAWVNVKVGDRVSAGALLLTLGAGDELRPVPTGDVKHAAMTVAQKTPATTPPAHPTAPVRMDPSRENVVVAFSASPAVSQVGAKTSGTTTASPPDHRLYAGPSVRKLAREMGVDLREVKGTGPRGRIVAQDVHNHVRSVMSARHEATQHSEGTPFNLLPWPKVDYGKYGPVETQPISRIQKISAANLHRNWVSIPHVTNHDDADITELEAFRADLNREHEKVEIRVSPLAFIMKAAVSALQTFPVFNSSLDGETIVLKRYYHLGFAADTPSGLVVPVIRNADQKGVLQLAREMSELAAKARAGKLAAADLQGGTFSISSLGGIGGSYFTPIINAPEVAILGVGKATPRVIWKDGQAQPRLYLPLSLSWDHRVVDGAAAGRFNAHIVRVLADLRRLIV